jgi:hypothetical protein
MKSSLPQNRGYIAMGVEGVSKAVNLGNLLRSAHAFGASFVLTVGADPPAGQSVESAPGQSRIKHVCLRRSLTGTGRCAKLSEPLVPLRQ